MYVAGMTRQAVMLLFSIKEQEVQQGHYHITLNMVSEMFVSECSCFSVWNSSVTSWNTIWKNVSLNI